MFYNLGARYLVKIDFSDSSQYTYEPQSVKNSLNDDVVQIKLITYT